MNKETAFKEWEKQRKFARSVWESKHGSAMPWGTPLHGEWIGWEQGVIAGAEWQKQQSATDAIEFADWCEDKYWPTGCTGLWRPERTSEEGMLTTKQLYELYKQSKTKS